MGDWEEEVYADHNLTLLKRPHQSSLVLLREDTLHGHAVAYDPEVELVKGDGYASEFGHGRILDTESICLDTIKKWYQSCNDNHGPNCKSPSFTEQLQANPAYFIDTLKGCIVRACLDESYVALSYVWGNVDCLKLESATLEFLQMPQSLHCRGIVEPIPRTVLHSIELARLLGEKYLWVDSLGIVQDDEGLRQVQLQQMAAIYAKANITIVAADGDDAAHGLRGIREVSFPVVRNVKQHIIPFSSHHFVGRIFPLESERDDEDTMNTYYSRAWTFQEFFFSKRRLIFEKGSVFWDCSSTTWFEDVDHSDRTCSPRNVKFENQQRLLSRSVPCLLTLIEIVSRFNSMNLTYDEDCLDAIAGVAGVLSRNFEDGFLCGLPEMFFDVAMLWQPSGNMERRQQKRLDGSLSCMVPPCLPSWSWAGWKGSIDTWSWQSGCDFIKEGTGASTSRGTIPVTTWYSGASATSRNRREIDSKWYKLKTRYKDLASPLPKEWTRHVYPGLPTDRTRLVYPPPEGFGSHYYTHSLSTSEEFWYPIPIPNPRQVPTAQKPTRFLFSSIQRAWLWTDGRQLDSHIPSVSLWDKSGQWAGLLRLHQHDDFSRNRMSTMQRIELVAISRGRAKNSWPEEPGLEEWEFDERPKDGEWYEFYNVMWISWTDYVASRRGLGRVIKDLWERQEPREIDLILS